MSTDLYRVSKVLWAVKSPKDKEVFGFSTIEAAAEYLESIGVRDEEIDLAIIDMLAHGHTRAQFGAIEGRFIFSDNARLDELLGVA